MAIITPALQGVSLSTQQLPCIGCVFFYRNADVQGVSLSNAAV